MSEPLEVPAAMATDTAVSRVTVVNDSSEFVDLVRDALEAELACTVTGFSAPEVMVEQIAATAPHLLVVDLRLDDIAQHMSGWELIVLARAHRDLKTVPIILCSADIDALRSREEELASMAGVHTLTKPFSLDELYGLARRLLTP